MNRQDRAKQFIPFDALKGLQEELRIREERRTRTSKRQLDDSVIAAISEVLSRITPGDKIRVVFYSHGHYLDLCAQVSEIDPVYRNLKIGNEKIHFSDIMKIKIID